MKKEVDDTAANGVVSYHHRGVFKGKGERRGFIIFNHSLYRVF